MAPRKATSTLKASPTSLTQLRRTLKPRRTMTRKQAQQALAAAAALFASEVSEATVPTGGEIRLRGVSGPKVVSTSRAVAAADFTPEIGKAIVVQRLDEDRMALLTGDYLQSPGLTTTQPSDSGLVDKFKKKISDLFAVGEGIAAASGASQLQVTVGLPWTATIALTWDLPK